MSAPLDVLAYLIGNYHQNNRNYNLKEQAYVKRCFDLLPS